MIEISNKHLSIPNKSNSNEQLYKKIKPKSTSSMTTMSRIRKPIHTRIYNAYSKSTLGSIPVNKEKIIRKDSYSSFSFISQSNRFSEFNSQLNQTSPFSYNTLKDNKKVFSSKGYINGFISKTERFFNDNIGLYREKYSPGPSSYEVNYSFTRKDTKNTSFSGFNRKQKETNDEEEKIESEEDCFITNLNGRGEETEYIPKINETGYIKGKYIKNFQLETGRYTKINDPRNKSKNMFYFNLQENEVSDKKTLNNILDMNNNLKYGKLNSNWNKKKNENLNLFNTNNRKKEEEVFKRLVNSKKKCDLKDEVVKNKKEEDEKEEKAGFFRFLHGKVKYYQSKERYFIDKLERFIPKYHYNICRLYDNVSLIDNNSILNSSIVNYNDNHEKYLSKSKVPVPGPAYYHSVSPFDLFGKDKNKNKNRKFK